MAMILLAVIMSLIVTGSSLHEDRFQDRSRFHRDQLSCKGNQCEDTCSQGKCQCSDGKPLKPDMRTCDWSGYMILGSTNSYILQRFKITHHIPTAGKVTSSEFDFSTNTLFYVLEQELGWTKKYSLVKDTPGKGKKQIIDMDEPVGYLSFDMRTKDLFFAVGSSIKVVITNDFTKSSIYDFYHFTTGSITGMRLDHCIRRLFVVIREDGAIYSVTLRGRAERMITGLKNPYGLAVDIIKLRLYWVSDLGLQESNYKGCGRIIRRFHKGFEPDAISLMNNNIVWSVASKKLLGRENLVTGKDEFIPTKSAILSISWIYDHPSRCLIKEEPCNEGNKDVIRDAEMALAENDDTDEGIRGLNQIVTIRQS